MMASSRPARDAFRTPRLQHLGGPRPDGSLAIELGPHGIRVNAILPGTVEGERTRGALDPRAPAVGASAEAMRERYLSRLALRRMVSADDVAALALFLCSPAARNLTGQAISIDGSLEYL